MQAIEIHLLNGKVITASAETYDPKALASEINDQKQIAIAIGDIVVSKNMIGLTCPVAQA